MKSEKIKSIREIFVFVSAILILLSCSSPQNKISKVNWPESTSITKPWTRWWWHGSAVTKEGITANLEELKKAGFGGVEITPIYGVKGYEDKDINFLSKEWMAILEYTLMEGKRLDLGIDLANASGWPFGGPWISSEDACKNVQFKIYHLKEGESLKEKIEFIQEPLVRAVGHKVDISEVKYPISSNKNLQELALDQVRFKKSIPLQTLMAYNQNGHILDLTNYVDQNGKLNWKLSKGDRELYAIFQGWHGKMVERAGRGGEGNVIDHFSEKATKKFLDVFDQNAKDFEINNLRAFFNDSYEVDDALGESDWTPLLFDEFKTRRGYDLKNYLPALFGIDTEENNKRVLCDYRETISDLLLERFTNVWNDWSRKYNSIIRNQAHGSPANILDLYAASDIPETEGTSPLRIKMASSAGHVSGKPLIACEAATWLNEHFLSDLSQAKENFDRYLANGINHIVYHGTPYSPLKETWPGWMFYASVHFAPTNTWWNELETINSYVNNCQSFLQSSTPANDILLYYPIYDKWSTPGKSRLEHFGTNNDDLIKEISEKLYSEGYTFDYISDKQIQHLKVNSNELISTNINYKTLIVPKCDFIPLETFNNILKLANSGANIIFENDLPKDVPGLHNLNDRVDEFSKLLDQISFEKSNEFLISNYGNGKILKGENVDQLLNAVNVYPESLAKNNLWFNKVSRKEGTCYFISNWSDSKVEKWININAVGESAVWFNPMNKKYGKSKIEFENHSSEVFIDLDKGESLILQFYDQDINVDEYLFYNETVKIIPINNEWEVEFVKGGPIIPKPFKTNKLISWPDISEELKSFSGTAKYSTSFNIDTDTSSYLLELGEVYNSATVYLNGEKISTLVGPDFKVILEKPLLKKTNKLEIYVSNLMANRIIDMDKKGEKYKKFYNINFAARIKEDLDTDGTFTSKNWEPLKSGLLGPVKLVELSVKK